MHRNITNYLKELLVLVLHCYKLVPTTMYSIIAESQYYPRNIDMN